MMQKFRAWDKDNKKMIKVKSIHFMEDKEDFSIVVNPLEFISSEHVVLMQATGLQDQKGVDIYEGDIVRLVGAFEDFDTGIVEFWKGAFVVNYENVNADFSYFDDISLPIEVIGNIYENPTISEGKNDY